MVGNVIYFPHLYIVRDCTHMVVAPPKMFCNWYTIYQLWNCTHFRHPTDEQLRHVDIYFLATKKDNLQSVYFELNTMSGTYCHMFCSKEL